MLTKTFLKTRGFLILTIVVVIFLTTVVALVLRGILGSLNMASQIDQSEIENTQVRVNKNNLNQAEEFVTNQNFETLDLR